MSKKQDSADIRFPFFQVKAAGHVVEHTNKMDVADSAYRDAAKPAEIWEIQDNGAAKLLRRSTQS